MAEKLEIYGDLLTLLERNPFELPKHSRTEEDAMLDPSVGQIIAPTYFIIQSVEGTVGDCVLYNPGFNEIEFGINIPSKHRNKGYGSKAAKLLSDYCLEQGGYSRVHLKVVPSNIRAIRSYEKAGFRRCGKIVVDSVEFIRMEKIRRNEHAQD